MRRPWRGGSRSRPRGSCARDRSSQGVWFTVNTALLAAFSGSLCLVTSLPGFRLQALKERLNRPSSRPLIHTQQHGIRNQMPASPEVRLPRTAARLWGPRYRPRCIRCWRARCSAVKKAGMLVPSRRKAPCSPGSLRVAPGPGRHVQKQVTNGTGTIRNISADENSKGGRPQRPGLVTRRRGGVREHWRGSKQVGKRDWTKRLMRPEAPQLDPKAATLAPRELAP